MPFLRLPRPSACGAARRLVGLVAACAAVAACEGGGGDRGGGAEVERQALLMGTTFTARVTAEDRPRALEATEAVFDEVARLERLISSWDSTTALGRLNRAPVDRPVPVEPELLALLVRADTLAEETGRAFEPAVGALIDAWDARGAGRSPSSGERARAGAAVRAGFDFDPAAGTAVRRDSATWIDTGAFGKGAALERAGGVLDTLGVRRALLDFGGQVLTVGTRPGGEPWRIGVAHPRRRQEYVTELRVGPGLSVATSGGSERPGHILDPRMGNRMSSWGSVTVVSPDAVAADAFATALFVMGPHAAAAWAEDRPEGVLILDDGREGLTARWNPAMTRWLDTTAVGEVAAELPRRGRAP